MKLEELLRTLDFTKVLAQSQIATLAALATEVTDSALDCSGRLIFVAGSVGTFRRARRSAR